MENLEIAIPPPPHRPELVPMFPFGRLPLVRVVAEGCGKRGQCAGIWGQQLASGAGACCAFAEQVSFERAVPHWLWLLLLLACVLCCCSLLFTKLSLVHFPCMLFDNAVTELQRLSELFVRGGAHLTVPRQ